MYLSKERDDVMKYFSLCVFIGYIYEIYLPKYSCKYNECLNNLENTGFDVTYRILIIAMAFFELLNNKDRVSQLSILISYIFRSLYIVVITAAK